MTLCLGAPKSNRRPRKYESGRKSSGAYLCRDLQMDGCEKASHSWHTEFGLPRVPNRVFLTMLETKLSLCKDMPVFNAGFRQMMCCRVLHYLSPSFVWEPYHVFTALCNVLNHRTRSGAVAPKQRKDASKGGERENKRLIETMSTAVLMRAKGGSLGNKDAGSSL